MVIFLDFLLYTFMVRACVKMGYQPKVYAVVFGVAGGATRFMAAQSTADAFCFGMVTGLCLWGVLRVLEKFEAIELLWWPTFVLGYGIPFAGFIANAILVYHGFPHDT